MNLPSANMVRCRECGQKLAVERLAKVEFGDLGDLK
jgi:hypothetical protein